MVFFKLIWWIDILSSSCSFGMRLVYGDVIMGTKASQITSLTIVYSTFYWGADQRKHQSSASLAFVRGIRRWPVNFPHKGPVTRKMLPFDDIIMVPEKPFSQHRFRWWFSAVITWTQVDPYLFRHMASLGHNDLNIDRKKILIYMQYWCCFPST